MVEEGSLCVRCSEEDLKVASRGLHGSGAILVSYQRGPELGSVAEEMQ
jgi:hypothetical protein